MLGLQLLALHQMAPLTLQHIVASLFTAACLERCTHTVELCAAWMYLLAGCQACGTLPSQLAALHPCVWSMHA